MTAFGMFAWLPRFGLYEKRHWGDYFAILSRTSLRLISPCSISATRWKPRKRRFTPGQKKHRPLRQKLQISSFHGKLMKFLTLDRETPTGGSQQFSCSKAIWFNQPKMQVSSCGYLLAFSIIQSCFVWFAQLWKFPEAHNDAGLSESTRSSSGFAEASMDAKGFKRLMLIGCWTIWIGYVYI